MLCRLGRETERAFISTTLPFVLLGRALDHTLRVLAWAHARKQLPPTNEEEQGILKSLRAVQGRKLNKLFSKVRKSYRAVPPGLRAELRVAVDDVVGETVAASTTATE
jgi:hypothetical protein